MDHWPKSWRPVQDSQTSLCRLFYPFFFGKSLWGENRSWQSPPWWTRKALGLSLLERYQESEVLFKEIRWHSSLIEWRTPSAEVTTVLKTLCADGGRATRGQAPGAESSHLRTPGLNYNKAPLRWHERWRHRRFLWFLPSSNWTPDQWGNTLGEALHFSDPACLHCPTQAQKGLQRRETPAASVGRIRLQVYRRKFQIWRASPRNVARASSAPARLGTVPWRACVRGAGHSTTPLCSLASCNIRWAQSSRSLCVLFWLLSAFYIFLTHRTNITFDVCNSEQNKRVTFYSTRPPLPCPADGLACMRGTCLFSMYSLHRGRARSVVHGILTAGGLASVPLEPRRAFRRPQNQLRLLLERRSRCSLTTWSEAPWVFLQ